MSDWERAPSKDGWERASSSVNQIPGLENSEPSDRHLADKASLLEISRGLAEAGITAAAGMPAMLAEAYGQKVFGTEPGKVSGEFYQPRTEKGQEYAAEVGEFANRYLNPLMGGVGAAYFPKKGKAPKGTPDKITSKAEEIVRGEKAKAEALWERAPDIDLSKGPATGDRVIPVTREGEAMVGEFDRTYREQAIQRQLEAQREVSPAIEADVARLHDQAILENLKEIDAQLTSKQRREQAMVGEHVRGEETLNVDPQGQVFRGDTNEGNSRLSLERQTEAMDNAMTHKEVPVAERPLELMTTDQLRSANEGPHTDPMALMQEQLRQELAQRNIHGDRINPVDRMSPEAKVRPVRPELANSMPRNAREGMRPMTSNLPKERVPFRGRGGKQAGAINPEVFKEGFAKAKDLVLEGIGKVKLIARYEPHYDELRIDAISIKEGVPVGTVAFGKNGPDISSFSTRVADEFQKKGIATELYKFGAELGNDIVPSKDQSYKGKAMWEGFDRSGFSQGSVIRSPGNKQRGAILISGTGTNSVPTPPRRPTPPTPEQMAANQQRRQVGHQFPHLRDALGEFDVIKTKEEALALSKDAKDIVRDLGQKALGSGINFQAIMSNSPALKFARTVFRDARVKAEQFSERFITTKDTGLSPVWSKLNTNERIQVMETLMAGDKHQYRINESVMDQLGFSDKQKQFVDTFYKADDHLFTDWNAELLKVGLKQIKDRTGHFPGIFTGAYKTVVARAKVKDGVAVVDKKGNPVMESLGIIATDTRAQQRLAQEHVRKQFPEAKFVEQKRASLTGSANRYYSDIFSGMNDVMEMLGKEDPRFLEIQELVSGAVTQANNRLFNFNVHELSKKGVFGNDGNRPWLSAERNANDAFKSLVRYFEEGAQHHALQVPLKEVRDLASSPEVAHLPNTMKYLDAYMKKITGDDLSPLGGAINTILDAPFKLLPTVSWGNGKITAGIGVGPSVPLKVSGAVKNTMSQVFMGFGNYMFTMSQLIQPGQTGMPFMQLAAGRLGMDVVSATASFGKGGVDFMLAATEHMTGKRIDILPDHMREAYQYAQDRGLLVFSEMEKAYQGTQTKAGRIKDQIAEFNMKIGEQATRTPMLMAFTDLLVKGGIDVKTALPIAENLTQFSMIDYHAWERPMVYSKMGVLGGFAGGLTTFKHGYASMQVKLAKEVALPTNGPRQALPAAMSIAAMLALAGITGTPFFSEFDNAFQYLTDKFGGEAKTIRESFLSNLPEWANSGVISAASNLNIQGKFSSADMVPDSIAKAASPHLEAAGKIIANAIDVARSGGDEQSVRNLLLSITPSGWKGITENKVARDEDNFVIGKDGLKTVQRTDAEWDKRVATGLRPQAEAITREGTWAARLKQMKDVARQKAIAQEYERAIINNTIDQKAEKLEKEYMDRKGDINNLLSLYKTVALKKQLSEKERLEGLPSSLSGTERFMYYNK